MRLLSRPGHRVHRLAQGNLEAFVGGPIKGCLHEDGAIVQETGRGCLLPLVCRGSLCWPVVYYALQKTLWLCRKMEAEASTGPRLSTCAGHTYWVVCQLATHIMHRRCPNKLHGHVPTRMPTVPVGRSNLARTRYVLAGNNKDTLKKLDQSRAVD